MAEGATELTFKQIADSAVVRRLSRIISILLLPCLGGVAGFFVTIDHRVASIETLGSKVEAVRSDVGDLHADVDTLSNKMVAIQLDVATIKGVVQEMQRSRQADFYMSSPPAATAAPISEWKASASVR